MGLRIPKSDSAKMGMTRMSGKNRSKQRQQRGINLISVFSAISCKVRFREGNEFYREINETRENCKMCFANMGVGL